ncbi:MAG: SDR family oxidoreductase [Burkholderiaceae bacterium]|nr:SDR family oxidoreductase [Burkholderiaceae bacterium]
MTSPESAATARRTVLVTGAASGIGAATARRFLREGWNVVINHLEGQQAEAQEVAAGATAPGQRALCVAADVTQDADCVRMLAATGEAFGMLHALVNAAGISKMVPHSRLHDVSADDFQRIYAVNTIGPFQMIRAAAPLLKAASTEPVRASIVNISSVAALMGSGSSVPYACSKAAVNALTLSMARVLAPEVRVNAVCPVLVEQGFVQRLAPAMFDAFREHQVKVSPLKRLGHPDEVAEAIYWLSTGASMMTGSIVELDYGMHLTST